MPNISELCERIREKVLGAISHPLRGIIVEVPEDSIWYRQGGSRCISVEVTPSGASYPRRFDRVPWNNLAAPDQNQGKPRPGDFVTILFKGGSSEFPVVTSYHPGMETANTIAKAQAPQPIVPAQALIYATKPPTQTSTIQTQVNQLLA